MYENCSKTLLQPLGLVYPLSTKHSVMLVYDINNTYLTKHTL